MSFTHLQIKNIDPKILKQGLFGIEKEALRINHDGSLAMTPHPKRLGDPLANHNITLDFSESQIEIITAPHSSIKDALDELEHLNRKSSLALDGEYLWPFSMPCSLPSEDKLPIAKFGDSSEGKKCELYRKGLAKRYGKTMQMLCGIHFNISFGANLLELLFKQQKKETDYRKWVNETYLGVARNMIRKQWILIYLFGASPEFDRETYSCPKMPTDKLEAISLRLSRCGYSNPKSIEVDYNNFEKYLRDIRTAVDSPYPPYAKFKNEQINDHLLQIANEYYFPIRLKSSHGNTYLDGLEEIGVEYLELRIFDINPFTLTGLTKKQAYFTHLFFLHCLFSKQEPISDKEIYQYNNLQAEFALNGQVLTKEIKSEGLFLLLKMNELAKHLGGDHLDAYNECSNQFKIEEGLPWYQQLIEMRSNGLDFIQYGIQRAKELHIKLTKIND